jgi:hypothetical protein
MAETPRADDGQARRTALFHPPDPPASRPVSRFNDWTGGLAFVVDDRPAGRRNNGTASGTQLRLGCAYKILVGLLRVTKNKEGEVASEVEDEFEHHHLSLQLVKDELPQTFEFMLREPMTLF